MKFTFTDVAVETLKPICLADGIDEDEIEDFLSNSLAPILFRRIEGKTTYSGLGGKIIPLYCEQTKEGIIFFSPRE